MSSNNKTNEAALPDIFIQKLDLLRHLQSPTWLYDVTGYRIVWANPNALKLWESESLPELTSRNFQHDMPEAVSSLLFNFLLEFRSGKKYSMWWNLRPKGISKQVYCHFSGLKVSEDKWLMLCEGVIDKDTMETQFHLNSGYTLASLFDRRGTFLSANDNFNKLFDSKTTHINQLFGYDFNLQKLLFQLNKQRFIRFDKSLIVQEQQIWFEFEIRLSLKGHHILITQRDINQRKRKEIYNQHLVIHDSLTGLLNRVGLKSKMTKIKEDDSDFALFFIDLDDFKHVNDQFGHKTGDQLLQDISRILKQFKNDDTLLSRFAGDEFCLVYLSNDKERIQSLATSLINEIKQLSNLPVYQELTISASIGIALSFEHSRDIDQLFIFADNAMYFSKSEGRNTWNIYEPHMFVDANSNKEIIKHLSNAIENEEVDILYQPIFNIESNERVGIQVKAIWNSPTHDRIAGETLVNLAQQAKVLSSLNQHLVDILVDYYSFEIDHSQHFVIIDVYAIQLSKSFVEEIESFAYNHQLPTSSIYLSLRESALMSLNEEIENILSELNSIGIKVLIGDYGSGFSKIAHIHQFNIDGLKIKLASNSLATENVPLIEATQAVCGALKVELIVENIVNDNQVETLKKQGVHLLQGKYFRDWQSLKSELSQ